MNLYKVPLIICFILFSQTAWSQLLDDASPDFTKKDSLRGSISKYRIYDVKFYDLSLDINLDQKTIRGSNKIHFLATTDLKRVQVDLFEGLNIDGIQDENGKELVFKREYDAIFIDFPDPLIEGGIYWINVQYSGAPTAAKRPPWDGGFAWSKDSNGDHWVGVACQGVGASLWWPNKDHLSDEPDSMRISVTVPKDYINVSNGTLRNTKRRGKKTEYEWFVANPINNYNVSLNIAKYDHFSEIYQNEVGERLNIDYYVLPENLDKAKTQFKDTRPMIEAFEHYFGPYAFYEDGFKMIDVPYLGMEHQSAVAYGNSYLKGYNGTSTSPYGLLFDFIIIHEGAHEWWGNSVTAKDIADLWIHESFGTYAENLFLEYHYGYDTALHYLNSKRQFVSNSSPIQGVYGVNHEGSRDMYWKGALMLNTLRSVVNDDKKWFEALYNLSTHFKHKTTDYQEFLSFFNEQLGENYFYLFDQYLKHADLPVFEVRIEVIGDQKKLGYKWNTDVELSFRMPIVIQVGGKHIRLNPTNSFQSLDISEYDERSIEVNKDLFYVNSEVYYNYIDPNKKP